MQSVRCSNKATARTTRPARAATACRLRRRAVITATSSVDKRCAQSQSECSKCFDASALNRGRHESQPFFMSASRGLSDFYRLCLNFRKGSKAPIAHRTGLVRDFPQLRKCLSAHEIVERMRTYLAATRIVGFDVASDKGRTTRERCIPTRSVFDTAPVNFLVAVPASRRPEATPVFFTAISDFRRPHGLRFCFVTTCAT